MSLIQHEDLKRAFFAGACLGQKLPQDNLELTHAAGYALLGNIDIFLKEIVDQSSNRFRILFAYPGWIAADPFWPPRRNWGPTVAHLRVQTPRRRRGICFLLRIFRHSALLHLN